MAKTLREFLESTVQRDYKLAVDIVNLTSYANYKIDGVKRLIEYARYSHYFDSVTVAKVMTMQDLGRQFSMTKMQLQAVANVHISEVGELVKRLMSTAPGIKDSVPSFPWKHFKRLRDLYVHIGETEANSPERKKTEQSIATIWGEIYNNYFTSLPPPQDAIYKTPYMQHIIRTINTYNALRELIESEPTDKISLVANPNVTKFCKERLLPETLFPFIMHWALEHHRISYLSDQLKKPSIFFRVSRPEIYKGTGAGITRIRNEMAHFEASYFYSTGGEIDKEDVSSSVILSNHPEDVLQAIYILKAKLRDNLNDFIEADMGKYIQEHVSDEVNKYEKLILGEALKDPEKVMLMDSFVSWLSKSGFRQNTQDASILAAGTALQRLPATQSKEILAFVRSNKNDLQKPDELSKKVKATHGSKTLPLGIELFATTMTRCLENGSASPQVN